MSTAAEGSCLCGAITLVAKQYTTKVGVCHCSMCQKWSAGPFMAIDCGTELDINGSENIALYASSEWAERGFCKQCGSNLFYRLKQTGQYILSVPVFDNLEKLELDHQIFIEEKPGYYDFANQTHNMTGAEVFAQFAGD